MAVIPCGVGIVRKSGKYLIARRRAEDSFGLFWEFPGGKRHRGETFEDCVRREFREELGIEVGVGAKLMDIRKHYRQRTVWLHFFLCEYRSGEPSAIECCEFAWVEAEKLSGFRFPPANEKVIRRLLEMERKALW